MNASDRRAARKAARKAGVVLPEDLRLPGMAQPKRPKPARRRRPSWFDAESAPGDVSPAPGSQAWAETYRDNLGESPDY